MGFFSELLGVVAPVVGGLLGGPAGAAVGALLTPGETTQLSVGRVGGAVLTPTQLLSAGGTAQQIIAATGGTTAIVTGRLRKRTIIETFDPATGKVLRQSVTAGGVAVFAADAAAAKRFFRQIRKLDQKLPRRTVKQSDVKQLTDRVVKNALERAGDDPSCPK